MTVTRQTLAEAQAAWEAHLATYPMIPASDTTAWTEAFQQAEWLMGRVIKARSDDECARLRVEEWRCMQQCAEAEEIALVYRRRQRAMLGMDEARP